jgi:hypothetical protein
MKGPGPGSGTLAGHTLFPSLEPAGGLDAHMFIASPSGFAFCDEASLNIYDRDFALEMTRGIRGRPRRVRAVHLGGVACPSPARAHCRTVHPALQVPALTH